MAGEPELDVAIESIQRGETHIDLTGVGYLDDKLAARLADAIETEKVDVEWDFVQAQHEDGDFNKRTGDAEEELEYGSAASKLPHVMSVSVKMNRYGRYAIIGLTENPTDSELLPHGFGAKMSPIGLTRADGRPCLDSKYAPTDDIICVAVRQGNVELRRNGKLVEVLGPAPPKCPGLYAKLFIREPDVLVRLVETATCSKVATLLLSSNKIGDKGVASLVEAIKKESSLLTQLDLSLNRLCDDGAVQLAEALETEGCKLKVLNVAHNSIGDRGTARLGEALEREFCAVTNLDLTDNDVGDAGAIRLAEALGKESCCVRSVKLSCNLIESGGIIALAEALEKKTCKVEAIGLGMNRPEKHAKKRLAKALASTLRLDVV